MEDFTLVILKYHPKQVQSVGSRDVDPLVTYRSAEEGLELDRYRVGFEGMELSEIVPTNQFGVKGESTGILVSHERSVERKVNPSSRLVLRVEILDWRNVIMTLEIGDGHARDKLIQTIDLRRTVVLDIAVPFVDHVVMLGIEPAGTLGIAAESIHHDVVVPSVVAVTCAAFVTPDIATLAVDHRCTILLVATDVVIGASGEGSVNIFLYLVFPDEATAVGMPGIDVGLHMIMVAGTLVLYETGRVETLCQVIHGTHPFLGLRKIGTIRAKAPGLIEINPCKDGGVVVVTLNLGTEAVLPVLTGFRNWLSPEVRSVSHDQETKFVSPIEFARNLNLDVDTVTIQSEILGNLDFILHELVTGEGIETFRMVALVKAELKIQRLVVEGDIIEVRSREWHDSYLTLSKIGIDFILVSKGSGNLIKEGIVQVPKMLVLDRNCEGGFVLSCYFSGESVLSAGLESQCERLTLGRGCCKGDIDLDIRVVNIGSKMQGTDIVLSTGLQVNCLPNSPGISVTLLAIEVCVAGCVISLDHKLLCLAKPDILQLAFERSVSSLMTADFIAIKPDLGVPIGSTDHQENPLSFP
jgi:hypothetical protein